MGALQYLNSQRLVSDTGLLRTPDSVANLEQEPTIYELGNNIGPGEYGGLDFLFGEGPLQFVATPLESIPTPGIDTQLLARLQSSGQLTNTYAYQPRTDEVPGGPTFNAPPAGAQSAPSPSQPGSWSFSDTLKREVAKLQDVIRKVTSNG